MRILILLAQYAPALNPNVFRWAAIAGHWAAQGHEVHVLCSRHSARPDQEILEDVHVHRGGQATLMDWAYNLLRRKERRSEPGAGLEKPGRFRRMLEFAVDVTWRKLYWPDGSGLWYLPARRRALRMLDEKPFDAVISVGLPFTTHLVGMACKKRSPALRWLMDIEDPFCFAEALPPNNFSLYRRLNYRTERRAFQLADAVALTNANALHRYAAIFPDAAHKLRVIPPLYHLPPASGSEFNIEKKPGEIHLGYFGTFYRNIRSPDRFLELLAAAFQLVSELKARLHVHFFGYIEAEFMALFEKFPQLSSNFIFHGLLSRTDVPAAMQAMDILLHIGNTTDYHLPSKCVDYLFSGKPIINIAATEGDSFREFAGDFPGLAHFYWQPERGQSPPAKAFVVALSSLPAVQLPETDSSPFELEAIAKAYETALIQ